MKRAIAFTLLYVRVKASMTCTRCISVFISMYLWWIARRFSRTKSAVALTYLVQASAVMGGVLAVLFTFVAIKIDDIFTALLSSGFLAFAAYIFDNYAKIRVALLRRR